MNIKELKQRFDKIGQILEYENKNINGKNKGYYINGEYYTNDKGNIIEKLESDELQYSISNGSFFNKKENVQLLTINIEELEQLNYNPLEIGKRILECFWI